jgi:putative oxidoreductase
MTTATLSNPTTTSSKALNVGLWIAQGLLAAAFFMAGSGKATQPIADLAVNMAWVTALPEAMVRFIGTVEVLGAIGLLLPALTRFKTWLTPLAAAGLTTIMALAIPFHLARSEPQGVVVNLVLGSVAAFIAWGRYKKSPIAERR